MDTKEPIQNFVVAHDFSSHADVALLAATDLATRFGANLMLLHVVHEPVLAYPSAQLGGVSAPLETPRLHEAAREALDKVAATVRLDDGEVSTHVVDGLSVDHAIVSFCESHRAELLVMGTHGRTGMAHVFLGSVAERTLRRSPCPVLTVRSQDDESTSDPDPRSTPSGRVPPGPDPGLDRTEGKGEER